MHDDWKIMTDICMLKNFLWVGLAASLSFTSTSNAIGQTADRAECIRGATGPAVAYIRYNFETAAGDQDTVQGSGVIIKSDGHILTAAHVLRPPDIYQSPVKKSEIKVRVGSFFVTDVDATVISQQNELDVALLKIPAMAQPWPTAQVDLMPSKSSGTWLYALGYPGDVDLTGAGPGKITSNNAVINGKPSQWWNTDVPLNPGMSGGPIFNQNGEVSGLAGAIKASAGGTISYVIPINLAWTVVPLAGLTEYTLSPCADDPEPFVRNFVKNATKGQFNEADLAKPLRETILIQTQNTWHYKPLENLGSVTDTMVVERKDVPQASWFTIKASHEKGSSLWVVGYNRGTRQIDSSSFNIQANASPLACTTMVLGAFPIPDISTLDGGGNVVGQLSNTTASIIQECATPTEPKYRLHLEYAYYNGSGTWRGQQHITASLRTGQGVSLKTETFALDRSKCVYGAPETRGADILIEGGISNLISGVTLEVSRVSGTQTNC